MATIQENVQTIKTEVNLMKEKLHLPITTSLAELREKVGTANLEDYALVSPSTEHQTILPSENYDGFARVEVKPVTSSIDPNLKEENIKQGVTILGVIGEYDGVPDLDLQTKYVNPTSDSKGVTVTADKGYDALGTVHVNPIRAGMVEGLMPSIIKRGEVVLDFVGTYGPTSQDKVVVPSLEEQIIEPDYGIEFLNRVKVLKVDKSIDSNIAPENIRYGINILGVVGDFNGDYIFQDKTAVLSTEETITYVADGGFNALSSVTVPKVTSSIDGNIRAENIKRGIKILGVAGTYAPDPSMSVKYASPAVYQQTIKPDTGYSSMDQVVISAVTSSIDSNIKAANIREGVKILGVTGTMEPIKGETLTISPSTSQQSFTPGEGYNAITKVIAEPVTNTIDDNIIASNIKQGITILGVQGTYNGGISNLQNKIVTPTDQIQTITASSGFDALSTVTVLSTPIENVTVRPSTEDYVVKRNEGVFIDTIEVQKVTSDIDANIQPGNIKQNMSILGVVGTYKGEPAPIFISKYEGGTQSVTYYDYDKGDYVAIGTPGFVKNVIALPENVAVVGTTAECLFAGMKSLSKVPTIDFSSVTNMSKCFLGCKGLSQIARLNTSKVTNISYAFAESGITVFPDMDYSKVTDASYAFCRLSNGLSYIPSNLGELFPSLTTAVGMFSSGGYRNIQVVTTLGSPNSTAKTLDARDMFYNNSAPIELTIDSIGVNLGSNQTGYSAHFSGAKDHLIINTINGGYISDLTRAFRYSYTNYKSVLRINSENNFELNIPGCTSLAGAFSYFGTQTSSTNIPKLKIYAPDVVSCSSAFSGCYYVDELEITTTEALKEISSMFYPSSFKKISLIEAGGVTNCNGAIFNASSLQHFPGFHNLGKSFNKKTAYYSGHTLSFPNCSLPLEDVISILDNLYDLNITYDVANGGTLYRQRVYLKNRYDMMVASEEGQAAIARAQAKGWDISK